jgi:uncharacterized protein YecT (DUF1311 family)
MRARPGLLIMVAATVGLSTFAQSNARYPIDVQLELCLQDTAGRSTAGMRQCCYAAMEAWVEEMNKGYQTLLASLKPEGQAALREAQRAWLTYRDKQFELTNEIYMSEMQGTMYHVVATNNNMELVKERALHLKTMLDALNEQR